MHLISTYLRPGDRVRILPPIASLRHRLGVVTGRVTRRNGGYIYVRPSWLGKDRELEFIDGELEVILPGEKVRGCPKVYPTVKVRQGYWHYRGFGIKRRSGKGRGYSIVDLDGEQTPAATIRAARETVDGWYRDGIVC
jgi:hypothetical protein